MHLTAQQNENRNIFVTNCAFNRDCLKFCYLFLSLTSFVSTIVGIVSCLSSHRRYVSDKTFVAKRKRYAIGCCIRHTFSANLSIYAGKDTCIYNLVCISIYRLMELTKPKFGLLQREKN